MEKIIQYLASDKRDYDKGLLLLAKYGKNRILLHRLSKKPWHAKLEYELQKLVDRAKALDKTNKEISESLESEEKENEFVASLPEILEVKRNFVVKSKQKVHYNDLPHNLKVIYDETSELYKHSRSLHERLKLMHKSTDEQRKPLLTDLLNMQSQVRVNWDKIDAWDPKAEIESKSETTVSNIDPKRISANRAYISRNAKSAKPDTDVFVKVQSRINELLTAGEGFKDSQLKLLEDLGFKLQINSQ